MLAKTPKKGAANTQKMRTKTDEQITRILIKRNALPRKTDEAKANEVGGRRVDRKERTKTINEGINNNGGCGWSK